MKVFKIFFLFFFLTIFFFLFFPQTHIARADNDITIGQQEPEKPALEQDPKIRLNFTSASGAFDSNKKYLIGVCYAVFGGGCTCFNGNSTNANSLSVDVPIGQSAGDVFNLPGISTFVLDCSIKIKTENAGAWRYDLYSYKSDTQDLQTLLRNQYFQIYPKAGANYRLGMYGHEFKPNTSQTVYIYNAQQNTPYGLWYENGNTLTIDPSTRLARSIAFADNQLDEDPATHEKRAPIGINIGPLLGQRKICAAEVAFGWTGSMNVGCQIGYNITITDNPATAPTEVTTGNTMNTIPNTPTPTTPPPAPPCPEGDRNQNGGCDKIQTGLGPINTNPSAFIGSLFGILLGLSGGIALILILISGYQLMMSQGNPEKTQGAKDTLTSAIVGLLFIIFSLVILQTIGYDILHIPGFGK